MSEGTKPRYVLRAQHVSNPGYVITKKLNSHPLLFMIAVAGQRKCGNRGNCAWDDRNHKCHRAEQGDSDHFDPHAALGGSITTCKGKVDSEKCNSKYEGKCLDDDWGDLVQVACPIMCNTCDPNDVKHGEDADVTKDPEHPDFSQVPLHPRSISAFLFPCFVFMR